MTDEVVLRRFVDGDESAFNEIYRRWKRKVHGICWGVLHNNEDARDAAADTFKRVALKAHTFRAEAQFKTWIYRVALNCALLLRREILAKRSPLVRMKFEPPVFPHDDFELRDAMLDALSCMCPEYQEAFTLCCVYDYGLNDAAKMIGITVPALKSRLHRARAEMRRRLMRRGVEQPRAVNA